MSFTEAIKSVFSQYAGFSGRARRSEYWYFILFNMIAPAILSGLAAATGSTIFNILSGIYGLAVLIPGLAVTVRRLHDIGKSGWWILLGLIPCIGEIILLIWTVKDSDPGENQYGPNPKEAGSVVG